MANQLEQPTRLATTIVVAAFFAACSAPARPNEQGNPHSTSSDSESIDRSIPLDVPSDWLGYRLGLSQPRLVPVDTPTFAVSGADFIPTPIGPFKESTTPPAPDSKELTYVSSDKHVYKMLFSAEDAQKIGDYYRATGNTGGSRGAHSEPDVTKGWRDGVDNRVLWQYSSNDWPRDTIGALLYGGSAGCTATLFSSQLVPRFH